MKWNNEREILFFIVILLSTFLMLLKIIGVIQCSWLVVFSPIWAVGWVIIIAFLFKQVFLK